MRVMGGHEGRRVEERVSLLIWTNRWMVVPLTNMEDGTGWG